MSDHQLAYPSALQAPARAASLTKTLNWSLLVLLLFSHWSIAIKYVSRFMSQGHYQYFPLLLIFVGWMFWNRKSMLANMRSKPNLTTLSIMLSCNLLAVTLATIVNSSAFGMLSFILALCTSVYWCFGWDGLKTGLPMFVLLLFAIPLPLSIDQHLIVNLQFLASNLASLLLDAVGEHHFRKGVILVTEGNQFLTEEACSGIRSLFSSMAAMAMYGVLKGYPFWRHVVNQIQVLFWVVIGNALRVSAVIYVTEHYTDIIASGIGHELFGLAIFLFIFAMAVSTDSILSLVLKLPDYWYDEEEPEGEDEEEPQSPEAGERDWLSTFRPAIHLGLPTVVTLLALFVGSNLLGARVAYARYLFDPSSRSLSLSRLPVPIEKDLPEKLGEWQQVGFEHIHRGEDMIQAQDSYVWTFRKGKLEALVSIDCPWADWHNLDWCYSALGWNTVPTYLVSPDESVSGDNRMHSEIDMHKNNMHGFVAFCSVDRDGNEVLPPIEYRAQTVSGLMQQLRGNIASSLAMDQDANSRIRGVSLPASTLQLVCSSGTQMSGDDFDELRELFFKFRNRILKSSRYVAN